MTAPRSTLVIQLQRVGDLIQTTPLLRSLAAAGPVTVLAVDEWCDVIGGLPGIAMSRLAASDVSALNAELERCREQKTQPTAAPQVLRGLGSHTFDRVINLTPTLFSSWLAMHVPAQDRQGWVLTEDFEWHALGNWMSFFVAMAEFRREQFFNVVDLFRGHAPGTAPTSTDHPYVKRATSPGVALPAGRLVAFNPGASVPERKWNEAGFARLIATAARSGATPLIVGSRADEPTCQQVAALCAQPIPVLCGSPLAEMAALLGACELVVTNDTGAVHIAAGVRTPVLSLARGESFMETMPWGAGHWIVQGPFGAINLLDAEIACRVLEARLSGSHHGQLARALSDSTHCLWRSAFLPANTDPLGGVHYEALHQAHRTEEERYQRALRHALARAFLGEASAPSRAPSSPPPPTADAKSHAATLGIHSATHWLTELRASNREAERAYETSNAAALNQAIAGVDGALQHLEDLSLTARAVAPAVIHMLWQLRFQLSGEPAVTFATHEHLAQRTESILWDALATLGQ